VIRGAVAGQCAEGDGFVGAGAPGRGRRQGSCSPRPILREQLALLSVPATPFAARRYASTIQLVADLTAAHRPALRVPNEAVRCHGRARSPGSAARSRR
jgi:hypothetical protein